MNRETPQHLIDQRAAALRDAGVTRDECRGAASALAGAALPLEMLRLAGVGCIGLDQLTYSLTETASIYRRVGAELAREQDATARYRQGRGEVQSVVDQATALGRLVDAVGGIQSNATDGAFVAVNVGDLRRVLRAHVDGQISTPGSAL